MSDTATNNTLPMKGHKPMNTPSKPLADHDTLLEAIGSALAAPQPNVETLFALVSQAQQEATVCRRLADEAAERTLHPATKSADLPAALAEAEILRLTATRLERAAELAQSALGEGYNDERAAARLAAYERAASEGDRVASRITMEYRQLVEKFLDLLDDIRATEELIWLANRDIPEGKPPLHGPEGLARGFSDLGPDDGSAQSVNAVRLSQTVLPYPDSPNGLSWPRIPSWRLRQGGHMVPHSLVVHEWRASEWRQREAEERAVAADKEWARSN